MATSSGEQPGTGSAPEPATSVHTLRVALRHLRPETWRRLQVRSDSSLLQVHRAIQAAFDWEDAHVWAFEADGAQYGLAHDTLPFRSARRTPLTALAPAVGDQLEYVYDYGDSWEHVVTVESVTAAEPGTFYPRCVGGARACPPEDCGGVLGYLDLLKILADPAHPDHADHLEWLGIRRASQFDPEAFDPAKVNATLAFQAGLLYLPE